MLALSNTLMTWTNFSLVTLINLSLITLVIFLPHKVWQCNNYYQYGVESCINPMYPDTEFETWVFLATPPPSDFDHICISQNPFHVLCIFPSFRPPLIGGVGVPVLYLIKYIIPIHCALFPHFSFFSHFRGFALFPCLPCICFKFSQFSSFSFFHVYTAFIKFFSANFKFFYVYF